MKKKKMRMSPGDRAFVIINGLLLVLLFILLIYPILFVISASFSDPDLVNSGKIILLPRGITLDGYKRILQNTELWTGYANTIFYTVAGTLLNLAVTIPCAYALSRRDLPGRGGFMVIFMFTMYFSGGLIPAYLNVKSMGLLNTRAIMLINGLVSTYNVIVSRTFFGSTIPWEMHEAARVDGANDARTFLSIILPLSKPILVVMALYYGVARWNSYFDAMIYLRNRSYFPLQLFLREILIQSQLAKGMMANALDAESALAMANQANEANLIKYCVIIVSTAPMMIIYPWLQKFFAKGVMIGSVKG